MIVKTLSLYLLALLLVSILSSSSCHKPTQGCKDATATNYDINADESCSGCCTYPPKQGGFLFWSEDPAAISTCGTFLITLNNGKQSTITGFYVNPGPANCVNQVGGYFVLDVGTYTYTITRSKSGCTGGTGTITVVEGCTKLKID